MSEHGVRYGEVVHASTSEARARQIAAAGPGTYVFRTAGNWSAEVDTETE